MRMAVATRVPLASERKSWPRTLKRALYGRPRSRRLKPALYGTGIHRRGRAG